MGVFGGRKGNRGIPMKNCHDHGNSYKENHLIGDGLQYQRTNPLSACQKASWPTGRQDAGEGA